MDVDLGEGAQPGCRIMIKEQLPQGLYVDPYELASMREQKSKEILVQNEIDIEAPEYLSATHAIIVYLKPDPRHHGHFTGTVPVHVRYHRPTDREEAIALVTLPDPQLMIHCQENSPLLESWKLGVTQASCSASNHSICSWLNVNYQNMEMLRRSSVFAAEVMDVFDRFPPEKELISQAKALCRDYIHSRLIRAGIVWSKPEPAVSSPASKLTEVSAALLHLGDELEYIRPNVYRNIAKQLNISVSSESIVSDAFLAVATELFSAGITWGKVVALYAVAGGLAIDCVKQGQPAMVHTIVDCLGEFVRKTLVTWLRRRGGWADITKSVVNNDPSIRDHWLVSFLCTCGHFLKAIFFFFLRER
ncbi:bcl-2-related ovarian killer protein homolog A isoform X2 [Chiloscyllium plagiosum]|nr:bcl-2-related ovarian killer protein homolog A isoform X2 [Chiloscyllium plagiosum]